MPNLDEMDQDLKTWMMTIKDQLHQDIGALKTYLKKLETALSELNTKVQNIENRFYPMEKSFITEKEKEKQKELENTIRKNVYEELGILPPRSLDETLTTPIAPELLQPKKESLIKNRWVELFIFLIEKIVSWASHPGGIVIIIAIVVALGGPLMAASMADIANSLKESNFLNMEYIPIDESNQPQEK